MDNSVKTALQLWGGIVLLAIIIGWSLWFWTNFPVRFTSLSEIYTKCDKSDKSTEYCFGFEDGWKWADEQYQIQKAIDKFAKLSAEEIEKALIPAFDSPAPIFNP